MTAIHLINGPNLNLLGTREPAVYGSESWAEIEQRLQDKAKALGATLTCRQSNAEGQIIDWIQAAAREARALILNAGAYTHTSVAIHDALKAVAVPAVEVHLSNPAKRDSFRHTSYVSRAATGTISGFGPLSYELALEAAIGLAKQADA